MQERPDGCRKASAGKGPQSQGWNRPMQDHMPATPDGTLSAAAQGAIDKVARDEEDFVAIKSAALAKLTLSVGKDPASATDRDWFVAPALTPGDRIILSWLAAY